MTARPAGLAAGEEAAAVQFVRSLADGLEVDVTKLLPDDRLDSLCTVRREDLPQVTATTWQAAGLIPNAAAIRWTSHPWARHAQ